MAPARSAGPEGLGLSAEVRASGGVVWRRRDGGDVEVLLVHRPRYDDWTFPKGKVERGETDEEAAVREVEEETGLTCALGPELPSTRYTDSKARSKLVRYWSMETDEEGAPANEVDELRWLSVADAEAELSYGRDLEVLQALRVS